MVGSVSGRDGRVRLVLWAIGHALLQAVVLALLAWALPGFSIGSAGAVAITALVFTIAQTAAWPVIYQIAVRFHPLLFPLLAFTLSGVLLVALTDVVDWVGDRDVHVDGVLEGVLIVVGLMSGSTLLSTLFSLRDDDVYDWFVIRPLRREYADTPRTTAPGFLFLEIDGLAEPILRRALDDGWMPTLQRWLDSGSHRLMAWEPDLSSQTSASQAGILLGDNTDIPAYRWYEKATGTLMQTGSMSTARELESRLSRGTGLLIEGASRWNVFSGDAPDAVCTSSTFADRARSGSRRYLAYFANPYTLPRAVTLYVGDLVREWWQAWRQRRRDERPRIHRSFGYAFVRAATTTLMAEAALFMLIADVYRGAPAVYVTFFAYDEVAHHSGIDRPDSFKVLRTLDRLFALLERAVAGAPRPYHLVALSDHGQSMGATFRQRTGQTLGELVTSLVGPDTRVAIDHRLTEDWSQINVALSEAIRSTKGPRTTALMRRALRNRIAGDEVNLGPAHDDDDARLTRVTEQSDVVVLGSGSLGLISFPQWDHRLTSEEIIDHFPALIPSLINHEGIGFVLVHSATEGGLAIGTNGVHFLDNGQVEGEDPLAIYGPNAASHLRRTDGFGNAPDVLVMSRYDPDTGEVAAFEELVGSHGGLGGTQTQPFLLHPATLDPGPEPIVGARELHRLLKRWRAETTGETES
jgi:hypothetical protein